MDKLNKDLLDLGNAMQFASNPTALELGKSEFVIKKILDAEQYIFRLKNAVMEELEKEFNKYPGLKKVEGELIVVTRSTRNTIKVKNLELVDPKFIKDKKVLDTIKVNKYKKDNGKLPDNIENNESSYISIKELEHDEA